MSQESPSQEEIDLQDEEAGLTEETWHDRPKVQKNLSPEAFMEELCVEAGGYNKFFRSLILHTYGWWTAVLLVPAIFLNHHKCEAEQSLLAWALYSLVVATAIAVALYMEVSILKKLNLIPPFEASRVCSDAQWRLPLLATVLWKLNSYTDVVFIFVARDCGSSLWMPSFAAFIFGVVFIQLILNTCFACSDCDKELPSSFGFILLDFKLVNAGVRHILPFDPDANDLPMGRPVTLRSASQLVNIEKVIADIAQVSIQVLFFYGTDFSHVFVFCSIVLSALDAVLSGSAALSSFVQDELAMQTEMHRGTVLKPPPKEIDPEQECEMRSFSATPPPKENMPSLWNEPQKIGHRYSTQS